MLDQPGPVRGGSGQPRPLPPAHPQPDPGRNTPRAHLVPTRPCPGQGLHAAAAPKSRSLGQEAPALTALMGLAALQEEQLGPVQDVDQHGQLRLHQGLQPLLQGCDDVLDRPGRVTSGPREGRGLTTTPPTQTPNSPARCPASVRGTLDPQTPELCAEAWPAQDLAYLLLLALCGLALSEPQYPSMWG